MSNLQQALANADRNVEPGLARLFEFLRIPSISADRAYDGDCRKAAQWAAAALGEVGFDASVREAIGQPMVVGHWKSGKAGAPRVLFYGHYDVQPPDPVDLWTSKPFEPAIVEGPHGRMVVARGASDDKGQVMTFIEACRAILESDGALPLDVTVFLEGEEESTPHGLEAFLKENKDELKADICLVCDTDLWDRDTPAITTMLRGILYEEVKIQAARMDLHSGMYGGAAQNPIRVLAKILAALHDDNGRITIPGFYDGVTELPEAVKRDWAALDFNPAEFLGDVGLSVPAGEKDRSVLEQIAARPTCDINGIWGGYQGQGPKTVIAAEASAKVSFRLVGEQDPKLIQAAFRRFVEERLPADCQASFQNHGASPAIFVPTDNPQLQKARKALADEWGRPAPTIGSGGSIPVVGDMQRILGMQSLLIGFALDDDRIHSPNEKYEVRSFHKGIRSWVRILHALGGRG